MIDESALKSIEKLHEMKSSGILSDEEFEAAKARLLAGDNSPTSRPSVFSEPAGPIKDDDYLGWALLPLRRYAQFTGRSSRREFWFFVLAATLVSLALFVVVAMDSNPFDTGAMGTLATALLVIFWLATLVPTFAVQVRRFHDQDRSGWFVLLNLIPYIGVFVVLAFMLIEGTKGENRYGPDPVT